MDFSTSKGFQILISLYEYTLIIIALYLEEVTNSQYLHHVLDINLSTQFTIIRKTYIDHSTFVLPFRTNCRLNKTTR